MGGPMGRYESTTFLGDGFIIIHFYNINYYSCSCVRTIARNSAKWVEPISMRDAENQRYFSHVNHGSEWIAIFFNQWLHGSKKKWFQHVPAILGPEVFWNSLLLSPFVALFTQVLLLGSNGLRTPSLGAPVCRWEMFVWSHEVVHGSMVLWFQCISGRGLVVLFFSLSSLPGLAVHCAWRFASKPKSMVLANQWYKDFEYHLPVFPETSEHFPTWRYKWAFFPA